MCWHIFNKVVGYLLIIALILGAYSLSPSVWKMVSSSDFLVDNIVTPVGKILLPVMTCAGERGIKPSQFVKLVFIVAGLLTVSVLSLLMMRELGKILENFSKELVREY